MDHPDDGANIDQFDGSQDRLRRRQRHKDHNGRPDSCRERQGRSVGLLPDKRREQSQRPAGHHGRPRRFGSTEPRHVCQVRLEPDRERVRLPTLCKRRRIGMRDQVLRPSFRKSLGSLRRQPAYRMGDNQACGGRDMGHQQLARRFGDEPSESDRGFFEDHGRVADISRFRHPREHRCLHGSDDLSQVRQARFRSCYRARLYQDKIDGGANLVHDRGPYRLPARSQLPILRDPLVVQRPP